MFSGTDVAEKPVMGSSEQIEISFWWLKTI